MQDDTTSRDFPTRFPPKQSVDKTPNDSTGGSGNISSGIFRMIRRASLDVSTLAVVERVGFESRPINRVCVIILHFYVMYRVLLYLVR